MKRLIFTFMAVGVLAMSVAAQNIFIHKTDGVVIEIPLNTIDRITFTSSGANTVADFEGNVYKVIQIGTQWWMAENLRSAKYADGSAIVGVYDYNDDPSLSASHGKYYTWEAAMKGAPATNNKPSGVQGVCPTGFHLPSQDEWKVLVDYVISHYETTALLAGRKLMESGTTFWNTNNGTNETGFSARGVGRIEAGGTNPSKELKDQTYFWSTSHLATNPTFAFRYSIKDDGSSTYGATISKGNAISVRCIKD